MSEEKKTGMRKGAFAVRCIDSVLLAGLALFFFLNPSFYQNKPADADTAVIHAGRIVYVLVLSAGGFAAVWMPNPLKGKVKDRVGILLSFLTMPLVVFPLEYANIRTHMLPSDVFVMIGEKKLLLTGAVIFLFFCWFLVIGGVWQRAAMLLSILVCVFGVVNYYVYAFRGVPLLASDLTVLQTAMNVAGDYDYRLDYYTFSLLLFTVFWCCVLSFSGKKKAFRNWKVRVGVLAAVLVLTIITDRVYLHTKFLRQHGVSFNTFKPQKSFAKNGTILTFIRSIQMMNVEPPEGYSPDQTKKLMSKYTGKKGSGVQPNIIIVMDEAFCDLQASLDFETDVEVCPFFSSLRENTIRGKLYVSSYGGRTANTEYEVLTEDSMAFLPGGSTPYQIFIKQPMPNLDSTLEKEGYSHTVGMHPYMPSGYNRKKVYELFGFDNLLFLEAFEGASTVGGRVSDDADVDKIIQEYEEARKESDAPFFIHNVTMQNHSPYEVPAEQLGDPVHILADGSYPDAESYLTLIRKSDQAFEKLVGYFENIEEPTVILFYGDHQPRLSDDFCRMAYGKTMDDMEGEELLQYYDSNYVIWANFDIEEKEMDISSNYLIPIMKQATGMGLTGYEEFLLQLHEKVPVVSLNGCIDRDGVFYREINKSSPWYEDLLEYNYYVYNHLLDDNNRVDSFFEDCDDEKAA